MKHKPSKKSHRHKADRRRVWPVRTRGALSRLEKEGDYLQGVWSRLRAVTPPPRRALSKQERASLVKHIIEFCEDPLGEGGAADDGSSVASSQQAAPRAPRARVPPPCKTPLSQQGIPELQSPPPPASLVSDAEEEEEEGGADCRLRTETLLLALELADDFASRCDEAAMQMLKDGAPAPVTPQKSRQKQKGRLGMATTRQRVCAVALRRLAAVCVFVAVKLEEVFYVRATSLSERADMKPAEMLALESMVLRVLDYRLTRATPGHALMALAAVAGEGLDTQPMYLAQLLLTLHATAEPTAPSVSTSSGAAKLSPAAIGGGALLLSRWMCGSDAMWPQPLADFTGLSWGAPRAGEATLVPGPGTSPELRAAVEALQTVLAEARTGAAAGTVAAACLDMYRTESRGLVAYLL